MNLHLFFDVYIEDAPIELYRGGNKDRFFLEHSIRVKKNSYRYRSKLDITRYTLQSYSKINWKSVVIRIECENPEHEFIFDEVKELFPKAKIERTRSDSALKYFNALDNAKIPDDDWVFFSPNNDHPFISDPERLGDLLIYAEEIRHKFSSGILSILYSHYTDGNNLYSPLRHEWGSYADSFCRLIDESAIARTVVPVKSLIDSVQIFKMSTLKYIYKNTKNSGRLIRNEETEFYLSKDTKHTLILPKWEICRHYDSYMHILDFVPPLFIPDGFFDKKIKVRYGYADYKEGWVNVNPIKDKYIYQEPSGVDLRCLLEDLPWFWRDRISEININRNFNPPLKSQISYYEDIKNPWRKIHTLHILINSLYKFFRSYHRRLRLFFRKLKNK